MLKGVRLTLMVGPLVPIPVSQSVLDALVSVEVTSQDTGPSGFSLAFTLDNRSILPTLFMIAGGSQIPIVRVIIVATVNGTPHVLSDGMVTRTEVVPGSDAGHSTLQVTGQDLSAAMDLQDFSGLPFPAMPAEGRVALLIAKYMFLGLIPLVIPSVLIDVNIPTSRIAGQRGTDLAYIKQLAAAVGYVFYIDPGPKPGMNIAYWGPQIKIGVPQPALNINMDAHTNVESLSFSFDGDKNGIPTVYYYNEITKVTIVVPLPPITPLNPPLGLLPPIPKQLKPAGRGLSRYSLPQAIMIGLAQSSQWAEAVTGRGELNVVRYGNVLKPRGLVGVRGVGTAFDGLHYVKSVTHKIKRGEYKQSFQLSRNGLISTLPRVPA
ncbi:hypothetical protein [Bradyrhizobium sp. 2S1]|uniref:hypothetical protein n=1 Tax=Bradyrhizobium sp. 2S1 TaxID=1404429 RepID=UPI00140C0927|nr:hypothetical protein [Bradyrhizobium sp. 2S1]MCK7668306.1 hypothetical protein [Bradyrhizobium sp. 2S1]